MLRSPGTRLDGRTLLASIRSHRTRRLNVVTCWFPKTGTILIVIRSKFTGEGASAPFVYLTGGPGAETTTAKTLFENPSMYPPYADVFG